MEQGAEPLVLLPGMVSDAGLFAPQIVALSAGRAVQVAHYYGEATVEAMAEAVLADAPPRFALAGHALGGCVALEVQRLAPTRVSRLALIATDCLTDTPAAAAAREDLIVAARCGRIDDAISGAIPSGALAPGPRQAEVVACLLEMARRAGPDIFVRHMRALQKRPDQQRALRALHCPVLVLGGRHDSLCPVRRQEFTATLVRRARLRIVEAAGHVPTLEAPEETSDALAEWLDVQAPLILRRSRA